jgi:hypothetical protein
METNFGLIFNQEFITLILTISAMVMAVTAKVIDLIKTSSKLVKILISLAISFIISCSLKFIGVITTWAMLGQIIENAPKAPIMPSSVPNNFYFVIGIFSFIMANGLYDLVKNFIKK